eukprot:334359-Prorocentrum_minimum.AAC.1
MTVVKAGLGLAPHVVTPTPVRQGSFANKLHGLQATAPPSNVDPGMWNKLRPAKSKAVAVAGAMELVAAEGQTLRWHADEPQPTATKAPRRVS